MRDLARISSALAFQPQGWFLLPQKYEALVELLAQYQTAKSWEVSKADRKAVQERITLASGPLQPASNSGDQSSERIEDRFYTVHDGVAIVTIAGIIGKRLGFFESLCGGYDVNMLNAAVHYLERDERVDAVLLDMSSPGGTGWGLPESVEKLRLLSSDKPVIAYTDTEMCSACYWLAMGADHVWAAGSATVGSIGSYITFVESSQAYAAAGLERIVVRSGDLKAIGMEGKPLEDNELKFLEASLEEHAGRFRSTVRESRGDGRVAESTMQGQWFSGDQALQLGLIDRIVPTLSDAVAALNAARIS